MSCHYSMCTFASVSVCVYTCMCVCVLTGCGGCVTMWSTYATLKCASWWSLLWAASPWQPRTPCKPTHRATMWVRLTCRLHKWTTGRNKHTGRQADIVTRNSIWERKCACSCRLTRIDAQKCLIWADWLMHLDWFGKSFLIGLDSLHILRDKRNTKTRFFWVESNAVTLTYNIFFY